MTKYESSLKPTPSILAVDEEIKQIRLQINALILKERELFAEQKKLEAILHGF